MGKVNRRRNTRNKKTGIDAASATATATTTALVNPYSASSGTNPCYHGSTADKFQPGSEYLKAVEEYLDTCHQISLLNNQDGNQVDHRMLMENPGFCRFIFVICTLLNIQDGIRGSQAMQQMKYEEDHRHLMKDPEFSRFIFAFCTQQYLKSNNFKAGTPHPFIHILLTLGIRCRYSTDPEKVKKYFRDISTERGKIKVLARETTTHCNCMNEAKDIAKTMDKMGQCHGCRNDFPKETLRLCDGCQFWKYHDRKCQLRYWPIHEADCKQMQNDMQVRVRLDRMKLKLEQGKMQNDMQVRVLLDRMKLEMEQVKRNEE